ncbi:MAG: I78 family peptidase inhibitor [Pseudomonadota bacterium]
MFARPPVTLCAAMAALLLAGCAGMRAGPMAPPVPDPTEAPGGTCDAVNAQFTLGKTVDERLGEEARVRSGARLVRVLRPGQVLPPEPDRPARLNLEVDATGRITRARCG